MVKAELIIKRQRNNDYLIITKPTSNLRVMDCSKHNFSLSTFLFHAFIFALTFNYIDHGRVLRPISK
jgi:hypothetical protein